MDTNNFRFSVSSVKTFRQCGTKFKFEKIDKEQPREEVGHARWLGKIVHASIYQSIAKLNIEEGFKSWEIVPGKPNEHAALTLFEALWVGGIDERTKEIYKLEVGSDIPTGRFRKKPKLAALNTDDQKLLEAAWKMEARKMVKEGVKSLSSLRKILEIEKKIEFVFLGKNFLGYLDIVGEDEDGKVVFLDFKTVWDKPTPYKLQDDPQFVVYPDALKGSLNLDYYPTGYFVHLRSGSLVPLVMTDDIMNKMKKSLSETFSYMEDNIYHHRPGILCNYCDFQYMCPQ